MTAKGFPPQQILQAINNKLHNLLPTGMFLAAQFVKVSAGLDHLSVFNCGMPDIFLLDGKTRADGECPTNMTGGLCGFGHPEGGQQVIDELAEHAALLGARFGDRVDEWRQR